MSSLNSKALKGVVWSLTDNLTNKILNVALLIYLSRLLSPSDFGLIAMLAVFLSISESLINSGLSQALIQRSHKVTETDLSTVFYTNLVISISIYILLYLSSPLIANFYSQGELVELSRVLFLVIIINSFLIVPKAILSIKIDFKSQGIANIIATLISSIFAIIMVINDFGYWSLVGMNVSRALSSTIVYIFLTKWYPKESFNLESFKSLFGFGSKVLFAGLAITVTQNLYTIVIGRYFSPSIVGFYHQANNYTNVISVTISSVIQKVTFPIMASIQEEHDRLISMYKKAIGITALLTFPVFLGFISISEEFVILLLGDKWVPIIPLLVILSLSRMITPINVLNLNLLNSKGRSDLFLKSEMLKVPFMLLGLFFTIPYGITAVAVSQLVVAIVSIYISSYYPGKLFGFGFFEQLKVIRLPFFVSIAMCYFSSLIVMDTLGIQIIVKIIFSCIFYIGCCFFLKFEPFKYVVTSFISRVNK